MKVAADANISYKSFGWICSKTSFAIIKSIPPYFFRFKFGSNVFFVNNDNLSLISGSEFAIAYSDISVP